MTANSNKETTPTSIHPATRMGHVSLTAGNLENQISFYQNVLGFSLHWRNGQAARMGTGSADLLHLVEEPNVKRLGLSLTRPEWPEYEENVTLLAGSR